MKSKSNVLLIIIFVLIFLSGTNVDTFLHLKPNLPYDEWPAFYHFAPSDWLLILFFILTFRYKFLTYKPEIYLILILSLAVIYNSILGLDSDLRNFIPALLIPPLFSILLQDNKRSIDKKQILKTIYIFYYLECSIAIFEKIFMVHIFPQIGIAGSLLDLEYSGEFRSTSLFGHPLANATFVTLVISFTLMSNISFKRKLLCWFIGFIAILCFNTRLAIVLNLGLFLIYSLDIIFSKKTTQSNRLLIVSFIVIVSYIISYALSKGFGGRLMKMGLYDQDSAAVRIDIWNIFDYYSIWNLLYKGIDFNQQDLIMSNAGVDYMTIENFWLVYFLRFGLIILIIMTIFYFSFYYNLSKGLSIKQCLYIYIPFLIQVSSFNSIASGNNIQSFLILFLFIFRDKLTIKRYNI